MFSLHPTMGGRRALLLPVGWSLPPQEMESMLSHFQSTLTNISAEIQTLQGQSLSINTKLKNRQAVRKDLHDFVDNIMVQDHLVL